jgi:conjugative transfer signal peptidase TraF
MNARRFALVSWSVAGVIGTTFAVGHAAGLRVNTTASAPKGIWHVAPLATDTIKRGDLVEACPSEAPIVALMRERTHIEAGDCGRTGVTTLLKRVSAIAGDRVTLRSGQAARVNGSPLPNTAPDPHIPAWPDGDYVVLPGQVWLFSSHSASSFDSRYFGPVPIANVRGQALPILIHGDAATMTTGVSAQ